MLGMQPCTPITMMMVRDLIVKTYFEEGVYEYGMLSLITVLPPAFIHSSSTVHLYLNGVTVRTSIVLGADSATITLYVCVTL
jgi:hypothetical protein